MTILPPALAAALDNIEPGASFIGTLPKLTSSISHKPYYVKVGTSTDENQYIGEAESLKVLEECSPGLGPKLLAIHTDEDTSYMISEYLEFSGGAYFVVRRGTSSTSCDRSPRPYKRKGLRIRCTNVLWPHSIRE